MSHIHLPDGVVPVLWWVLGYITAFAILALGLSRTKTIDMRRKVPLLGIMSALMLIGQSVPLGFIPFHLSLAVLSGIVLGPWLGFMAVFVTNLFLALIGHGGITVVGLNTLVVGSEAVFGYLLFSAFGRYLSSIMATTALATSITLALSVSLMVGVVMLSQVNPSLVAAGISERSEGNEHGVHEKEHDAATAGSIPRISVVKFIKIVAPIATLGILIESFVIGLIVRFVIGVRPDVMGR